MSKEDIDFLISIQDLEQPYFDNACLERENKQLKEKISKAIEYLKNNEITPIYLDCKLYETEIYKELLEILGDKENE